jgi:hypothetical protein
MVLGTRIGGTYPVSSAVSGLASSRPFRSPRFYGQFRVTGITRDSAGAALGNCTVKLFQSSTDIEVVETTSDGSGNFTCSLGNNAGYFYLVAYKPGAPDVAGTSVNTLVADPA